MIPVNMRDTAWLISQNRLLVRGIVEWSCFIKTKTCKNDEKLEHLSIDCYRTQKIRTKMYNVGFNANINQCSVMYGVVLEKL